MSTIPIYSLRPAGIDAIFRLFLDLTRRGYRWGRDLFYYRTASGKEVDFVLRRGRQIVALIQVCLDLTQAMDRELSALEIGSRELNWSDLTIVTWDTSGAEKIGNRTVKIIPLYQWLLKRPR